MPATSQRERLINYSNMWIYTALYKNCYYYLIVPTKAYMKSESIRGILFSLDGRENPYAKESHFFQLFLCMIHFIVVRF